MNFANIKLGSNVDMDSSTSINNVIIHDGARISKHCSIYGGPDNLLELGRNSYVGMNSILNGFAAKLTIGDSVSISQFVNIMVDSGPNASPGMLKLFPIISGPINIGNDCWIGTGSIIMPNVTLGEFCIVAANSFVNKSFPAFSIIGGNPARMIRSFTESEKEKMFIEGKNYNQLERRDYEINYVDLPFEDSLRIYRKKKVLEILLKYPHDRFLEIGCGPDPLFMDLTDFEEMTVIEPGKKFFNMAEGLAKKSASQIVLVNELVENVVEKLQQNTYDFIVIGGFLHEVDNPDIILEAVKNLCSGNTIVYSFVPNARSFHRILAYESGIIKNIYEKSGHDDLFKRHNVFNIETFNELFSNHNFKVLETGTYFVKPFSHKQMDELLTSRIINNTYLDGLEKMIEFMPDMGAELWNICKIDVKVS